MARKPPKRFETLSTMSKESAIAALRLGWPPQQRGQYSRDAARCQADDRNQDETINYKIQSGRVRSQQLGDLAKGLNHKRAEERCEQGSCPPDDGRKERVDGNPWSVGNGRIDE